MVLTSLKSWTARAAAVIPLVSAGLVLGPWADVAHAAPLRLDVNVTGNASDTFLDGICDTSGTAGLQCTLRGAIQEANANAGHDTITFSVATPFRIALTATGLPAITSPVTIDGTTLPASARLAARSCGSTAPTAPQA